MRVPRRSGPRGAGSERGAPPRRRARCERGRRCGGCGRPGRRRRAARRAPRPRWPSCCCAGAAGRRRGGGPGRRARPAADPTVTDDVDRAATTDPARRGGALESGSAPDADVAITARGPAEVIALAGAVTSSVRRDLSPRRGTAGTAGCDLTSHLARRNHGLVDRLVTQIGELETAERSPTVLLAAVAARHPATRISARREHAGAHGRASRPQRPRPAAVTGMRPRWRDRGPPRIAPMRSNRRRSAARPSRTSPTWWPSSSRTARTSPRPRRGPRHRHARPRRPWLPRPSPIAASA